MAKTMLVKYTGRDDSRVLDGHDLNKAGVEGFHKTEFPQNVEVEVSVEVATALVQYRALLGDFEIVGREAPEEATDNRDDKKSADSK